MTLEWQFASSRESMTLSPYALVPSRTALLVIDMTRQPLLHAAVRNNLSEVVTVLEGVIEAARSSGMPIVYTTHQHRPDGSDMGRLATAVEGLADELGRPRAMRPGSPEVEIMPVLAPKTGDVVVTKNRYSGFFATDLDTVLRTKGIDTVVVSGVATHVCCAATAFDAVFRGYQTALLADAMACFDLPDYGWGPTRLEEVQRVTLAGLARSCEVITSTEFVRRVRSPEAAPPSA